MVIEEFIRKGDEELIDFVEQFIDDDSAEVRFQLALSLRFSPSEHAKVILDRLLAKDRGNFVLAKSQEKYKQDLFEKENSEKGLANLTKNEKKLVRQGFTIYSQLCTTCHGPEGKGIQGVKELPAPALASNKHVNGDAEKLIRILLHGLKGLNNGVDYMDVMPALGANDDEYIASVLSYIRNDMGNKATVVTPEEVKSVREQTTDRKLPWTWKELDELKKK